MRIKGRQWMLAAAAIACAMGAGSATADVRAGTEAWRAGNYEAAVREWRPLAEAGDQHAQFNLGQAYKLGRGVPLDQRQAQTWFERAARQGHAQAEAALGLTLFQNGQRAEAMPWIERAAGRGDPRAQYVLGTAHFNGDLVARDWPRAYALMRRAADQGLPQAASSIAEMERHMSAEDRARGTQLARQMSAGETQVAAAAPAANLPPVRTAPPVVQTAPPRQPRIAGAQRPVPAPPAPPVAVPTPPPPRRAPEPPRVVAPQAAPPAPAAAPVRPAPVVGAQGWRVQLGAFTQPGAAERAWQSARGRVSGLSNLQPYLIRAGNFTRLQAGPLANRAAADRICASARSAGQACIVVAP